MQKISSLIMGILLVSLFLDSSNAYAETIYYNSGSIRRGTDAGQVFTPHGEADIFRVRRPEESLLIPDMEGNYAQIPLNDIRKPDPSMKDVHEVRLKARELASQLLETWPISGLNGMIAVPTTFTPVGHPQKSTPFGQYLAEAMIYEFNTRGLPVYEIRYNDQIQKTPSGSFGLPVKESTQWVGNSWAAVVLGTFYSDKDAVIVNVRMIRASDNMVLRSAQTVLPMTPYLARMTMGSEDEYRSVGQPFGAGSMGIVPGVR